MKTYPIVAAIILLSMASNAQNGIRPNIYLQDMQYYNPASVAIDSNHISQTALYGKYKSVDNENNIWHKPMNIWLSHTGRIRSSPSFYTISYVNDQYSFFSRNTLYVGYIRQVKIGGSYLNYGGRVVANMDVIDWNKFVLPHSRNGTTLRLNPDIDAGLAYQYRRFNAGLGFKNLIGTTTRIEGATLLKNQHEVNFNVSYRQPVGGNFSVTPFVLLAHERNTLIDAGLCFTVFNIVRASYALRVNELKSVIVVDADVYKGWSIGVGYDRSSLVSDNNIDFVIRYRR